MASIQTLPPQVSDPFHPFHSTGTVSLGPNQPKHPVRIVRDTCVAQYLISQSALPNISDNYTVEKVNLREFHDPFPAHLVEVELRCGLVLEAVMVGVSEDTTLLIPDVDFILGKDLTGSLVYLSLIILESPLPKNPSANLEQAQPDLLPGSAHTRSQAKADKISEPTLPPQSLIQTIFPEQILKEAQQNDQSLSQLYAKAIPKIMYFILLHITIRTEYL